MAFNYYAQLKRIILGLEPGWYIRRINEPTVTKKFNGESTCYDHYYRLYRADSTKVPYGKFQKLDKLADLLGIPVDMLPLR